MAKKGRVRKIKEKGSYSRYIGKYGNESKSVPPLESLVPGYSCERLYLAFMGSRFLNVKKAFQLATGVRRKSFPAANGFVELWMKQGYLEMVLWGEYEPTRQWKQGEQKNLELYRATVQSFFEYLLRGRTLNGPEKSLSSEIENELRSFLDDFFFNFEIWSALSKGMGLTIKGERTVSILEDELRGPESILRVYEEVIERFLISPWRSQGGTLTDIIPPTEISKELDEFCQKLRLMNNGRTFFYLFCLMYSTETIAITFHRLYEKAMGLAQESGLHQIFFIPKIDFRQELPSLFSVVLFRVRPLVLRIVKRGKARVSMSELQSEQDYQHFFKAWWINHSSEASDEEHAKEAPVRYLKMLGRMFDTLRAFLDAGQKLNIVSSRYKFPNVESWVYEPNEWLERKQYLDNNFDNLCRTFMWYHKYIVCEWDPEVTGRITVKIRNRIGNSEVYEHFGSAKEAQDLITLLKKKNDQS